jgi:wyosine [tRNA(Phe)-imidazoG37] synthetase (radical SAM superfamily)
VVGQVRSRLESSPDVIALAGSGEPTLHTGIGEVIRGIKALTDVPVVVLTNGSLLGLPAVQDELAAADIVVPSLDAPDAALFERVNRPHGDLRFSEVVDGIVGFRGSFPGKVWLEILLLAGLTDSADAVARLVEIAARIAPDRIQLNTVVRPPAEVSAGPVAADEMRRIAALFTPVAEVVGRADVEAAGASATSADVLALISRRPCTVEDIASGLGIHHGEAIKLATALSDTGAAEATLLDGRWFYAATNQVTQSSSEEKA